MTSLVIKRYRITTIIDRSDSSWTKQLTNHFAKQLESNHTKFKNVLACVPKNLRCLSDPQIEQDVGFSWLRFVTQPHSSQVQRPPLVSALLLSSGPFIYADKTEGQQCCVVCVSKKNFTELSACDARPQFLFSFPQGNSGFHVNSPMGR